MVPSLSRSEASTPPGMVVVDNNKFIANDVRPRSESLSHSWEPDVADHIKRRVEHNPEYSNGRPLMVGLVGPPGSGKGVGALRIADLLHQQHNIETAIIPHNGFHLPLEYLRTFPDPEDAIYRRGAPDTFHPQALHRDLLRMRDNIDEDVITTPGFDHAKGDPEPDQHTFDRHRHQVVICEGLYLLHDDDGWEDMADVFDLSVFTNADIDKCIERIKVRNQCIPGYSPEQIAIRAEQVDRVHADIVMKTMKRADMVVESVVHVPEQSLSRHRREPSHLNLITLHDIDKIEPMHHDTTDWTMDIGHTRPRSDSMSSSMSHHSESLFSAGEPDDEPAPPTAASFLGTWEPDTAKMIISNLQEMDRRPYMIALVGIPGGGKSVSSFMLANFLEESDIPTMVCPHDGYHYPLDYLRTWPNEEDAVYRRGAPDTFDPQALLRDLLRIREGDEEVIKLPAFDHGRGDPEPDTHIFDRNRHQVVICEGLYLLHDRDGWEDIANVFDLSIFMNANLDECMRRVKIRNTCIPGYTPEEIAIRVEKVDRVNALTALSSKTRADLLVDSAAMVPSS